jgi:dienelactone hydrolase
MKALTRLPRVPRRTTPLAPLAVLAGLVLPMAFAAPASAAPDSAAQPAIEVVPEVAREGDPVRIRVTGLTPGQMIRVGAMRPRPYRPERVAHTDGTFQAGRDGVVDLASDVPIDGTWERPGPFGLFGAMRSSDEDGAAKANGWPVWDVHLRVDLDNDGDWDDRPRARLALNAGQQDLTETAAGPDLPGAFLLTPPGEGPHPALILLGGSEGNDGYARVQGPIMAAHGYAVLGLPYYSPAWFGRDQQIPGLPSSFAMLPVDHLEKAAAWLRDRPEVDGDRVGLVGVSKGAELALLGASLIGGFEAVAAIVPSDVIWEGWGDGHETGETPGFSWRGEPLPFVPYEGMDETIAKLSQGEEARLATPHEEGRAKADSATVDAARIPVERIDAPVYLLAGGRDRTWPSAPMAQNIFDTRRAAGLPTQLFVYPEAGHSLSGPPSLPARPVETAARAEAWPALLTFLADSLQEGRVR